MSLQLYEGICKIANLVLVHVLQKEISDLSVEATFKIEG